MEPDNSLPLQLLYEFDGKGVGSSQEIGWTNEDVMNPYNVTSNSNVEVVQFGDHDSIFDIQSSTSPRQITHDRISESAHIRENLPTEESRCEDSTSSPSQPKPSTKRKRSRSLVSSSWNERFQELIRFREANDHCFVPHNYPANPKLSQWVRKQRHQRKRKEKRLHSTLSDERQELLTNAGFIWDSHRAMWQERYQSLELFQMTNGHCNVPSNFHDSSLSNWVKNQRKQFKLFQTGSKTTMNEERINLLNALGFNWNPRNL
ncbi:unnamed protein product [Pseudo-nitzschia multistriata]|uniref:Helicase-associated domain-containing protein n=1 Tax=Pseudo-nitzschia multistriata TaxID=183589 RepID=A0A448YUK6_9STRA|nr:unnamed protein product [Pseudo-nitzschia multistriata]